MEKNVGKTERIIRYLLALIFVILSLTIKKYFTLFIILALIMFLTAVLSYCPLYSLLKKLKLKK